MHLCIGVETAMQVKMRLKISKCIVDLENRVFLVVVVCIGVEKIGFRSDGAGDWCVQFSNGLPHGENVFNSRSAKAKVMDER